LYYLFNFFISVALQIVWAQVIGPRTILLNEGILAVDYRDVISVFQGVGQNFDRLPRGVQNMKKTICVCKNTKNQYFFNSGRQMPPCSPPNDVPGGLIHCSNIQLIDIKMSAEVYRAPNRTCVYKIICYFSFWRVKYFLIVVLMSEIFFYLDEWIKKYVIQTRY